MTKKIR